MQGRPPHLPASTVIRLRRSRFIEFALFFTIRNLLSKGKRAATGRAVGTSLTRGGSWVPHSFGLLAKGAGFDFSCIFFLHAPLLRILHSPARNPFNLPHLQLSLDRDRNHVVTCYLILRHHLSRAPRDPGSTTPQAASLRKLCVLRVSAFDSSSLGLTLNLQLSTFNRVSFLSSPHLCALCVLCGENSSSFRSPLIPRHSSLTTNSFTIRTSETPLPQLLYNPYLRAPFGSAGNKGLITPLESALTRNSPVSLLESALAESGGWGYGASLSAFWTPVKSHGLLPPENSALSARRHLVLTAYPASVSVNSVLSAVRACSKRVEMLIPFPSLNLQPSLEDPDLVGTFNLFT